MSGFKEVTYDQASNTVRIGPGQRWEDVMGALDGTGVTVVGGRIGEVGVGGLLLGGNGVRPHSYGPSSFLNVSADAKSQVVSAFSVHNTDGR